MAVSKTFAFDPRRLPIGLPRLSRILSAAGAVIFVCLLVLEVIPAWRQRAAILEIERYNGSAQFHPRGPAWLRELIGYERMQWFEEQWHVVFWADEDSLSRRSRYGGVSLQHDGPFIDDQSLKCVLGLPKITSLDLAFSEITDAALEHVRQLRRLEELRLEGCDITDASIPLLSEMQGLKELNVVGTKITKSGSRALQAALPGCDVQGPHNDDWLFFQESLERATN